MSTSRLMAQLDGARMVRYDSNADLLLSWHGGTGVHVYDSSGTEVSYWQVEEPTIAGQSRLETAISESMGEHMNQGYYPS